MSPSSKTGSKLAERRRELFRINEDLFKLFVARKALVEEIQILKESSQSFYDPSQEAQLFLALKPQLEALSSREWLAFSLLMEAHADAPVRYPAWSEGVHLLEAPSRDEHRMNPLLLKTLDRTRFEALRFNPAFDFLHLI